MKKLQPIARAIMNQPGRGFVSVFPNALPLVQMVKKCPRRISWRVLGSESLGLKNYGQTSPT